MKKIPIWYFDTFDSSHSKFQKDSFFMCFQKKNKESVKIFMHVRVTISFGGLTRSKNVNTFIRLVFPRAVVKFCVEGKLLSKACVSGKKFRKISKTSKVLINSNLDKLVLE